MKNFVRNVFNRFKGVSKGELAFLGGGSLALAIGIVACEYGKHHQEGLPLAFGTITALGGLAFAGASLEKIIDHKPMPAEIVPTNEEEVPPSEKINPTYWNEFVNKHMDGSEIAAIQPERPQDLH